MEQALFTINIKTPDGDVFGSEILSKNKINKIKKDIKKFFKIHFKFEYYEIIRQGSNVEDACDNPYSNHISFSVTEKELLDSITVTPLSKDEVKFLESLNMGSVCNCSIFEDMTTLFRV